MDESAETVEPSIEERILKAALELFNERGYGAAAVGDIAKRAEVGVGTVYRRWPDKPALANAVYRCVLREAEHYRQQWRGGRSRRAKFETLVRSFHAFAEAEPAMMLFLVGQPHGAYVDEENRAQQERKDAEAVELIEALGLRVGAEMAAAMTIGTIVYAVRNGTRLDGHELCDRLWRALSK